MATLRLINVKTFEMHDYKTVDNPRRPPYFVLSHRWMDVEHSNKDVSYPVFQSVKSKEEKETKVEGYLEQLVKKQEENPESTFTDDKGLEKLVRACCITRGKGNGRVQHFWMDNCCIDNSSQAELNSALNSMFRWYVMAEKCLAYLHDVSEDPLDHVDRDKIDNDWGRVGSFMESRWFRRGWTLQELLAPQSVEFYDHRWDSLGGVERYEKQIARRHQSMQSI